MALFYCYNGVIYTLLLCRNFQLLAMTIKLKDNDYRFESDDWFDVVIHGCNDILCAVTQYNRLRKRGHEINIEQLNQTDVNTFEVGMLSVNEIEVQ